MFAVDVSYQTSDSDGICFVVSWILLLVLPCIIVL